MKSSSEKHETDISLQTSPISKKYRIGWEFIIVFMIILAGAAVRLHEVGYSLDGDEVFSVRLASKSFSNVISESLQDTPHPPLYNILLFAWIRYFGASEISARSLSVLFSCIFLMVSYGLLRKFTSKQISAALLLIFAFSPFFVYYGQQARPYALIAFLAAANLLAFIHMIDAPHNKTTRIVWALSCSLLLYAQYMPLLLIAFQLFILMCFLKSNRLIIFMHGVLGISLILPWIIAAMGRAALGRMDPLPHISWIKTPSLIDFVWFYISIFGEGTGLKARWLMILFAIIGAAYINRIIETKKIPPVHLLIFLIGLGFPGVIFLVSIWGPKPVFLPRQLIGAAIAFIAAIGYCIETRHNLFSFGILTVLLTWTLISTHQAFPHIMKPPWRDIAAYIDTQYGAIPVVTNEQWINDPLNYYRKIGSTQLRHELSSNDKNSLMVCVCRPLNCNIPESDQTETRHVLAAKWQWGRSDDPGKNNMVYLYEIRNDALNDHGT